MLQPSRLIVTWYKVTMTIWMISEVVKRRRVGPMTWTYAFLIDFFVAAFIWALVYYYLVMP